MSNKLKAVLIISLAFNVAVLGALAFALISHPRIGEEPRSRRDFRERIDHRCRRLADRIELPDEKARHLERIMLGEEEKHELIKDRLHAARKELFEMAWAEEPDEVALMEKVDEIARLQGELEKLFTQRLLKARSILDPEEEKRFREHMRRRMESHFPENGPRHHIPHRDGGRR